VTDVPGVRARLDISEYAPPPPPVPPLLLGSPPEPPPPPPMTSMLLLEEFQSPGTVQLVPEVRKMTTVVLAAASLGRKSGNEKATKTNEKIIQRPYILMRLRRSNVLCQQLRAEFTENIH
jgi:hypothetical protein